MATKLSTLKEPIPLIFRASSCYWHHFRMNKIHKQWHPSAPSPCQNPGTSLEEGAEHKGDNKLPRVFQLLSPVTLKSQLDHLFCPKRKPKSFHHLKEQNNKSRYRVSSSRSSANTHQPIPAATRSLRFSFFNSQSCFVPPVEAEALDSPNQELSAAFLLLHGTNTLQKSFSLLSSLFLAWQPGVIFRVHKLCSGSAPSLYSDNPEFLL